MNYRAVSYNLGRILSVEAALLVLPAAGSLIYQEGDTFFAFALTVAALAVCSLATLAAKPKNKTIHARDGYVIVALSWILMSVFGAMPFVLSGYVPNIFDAFFETVSGFTTTGATCLTDVEALPKSLLFWRSFTNWIGGMGILVFIIAIMPKTESSSMHIMRAEVPGPTVGKLVSKLRVSARILYGIYIVMTLVQIVLLAVGGMPLFDSIVNSFATAGTGGFSVLNNSIECYSSLYSETVIGIFMLLFGVNFNLYYLVLVKQARHALKSEELHWYLGTVAAAVVLITIDLFLNKHSIGESFRYSFFQVSSMISTTGFSSTNYDTWPVFSKAIIILLMFCGGCAGSTSGGMKISRMIVLIKGSIREIKKSVNPRIVQSVKVDHHGVDESVVKSIFAYFAMLILLIAASTLLLCIDGRDFMTTLKAVFACVSNLGRVGHSDNFAGFSGLGKLLLSFDMLAGRLELIPMFMLFSPLAWSRKHS